MTTKRRQQVESIQNDCYCNDLNVEYMWFDDDTFALEWVCSASRKRKQPISADDYYRAGRIWNNHFSNGGYSQDVNLTIALIELAENICDGYYQHDSFRNTWKWVIFDD